MKSNLYNKQIIVWADELNLFIFQTGFLFSNYSFKIGFNENIHYSLLTS